MAHRGMCRQKVSIHAPVKVRLQSQSNRWLCHGVSIHAPVKVRLSLSSMFMSGLPVSIHAPVKVRRCSWRACTGWRPCFNPRTREGATCYAACPIPNPPCFNPRTREGATACCWERPSEPEVSIHAPVKVRPHAQAGPHHHRAGFNPRTREGATPLE